MTIRTSAHLRALCLILLFAAAAVLGGAPVAQAQQAGASGLVVTLSGPSGEPLAGATVTLQQASGSVRTAVTNKNGTVRFDGVPAGDYLLKAEKLGMSQLADSGVSLAAGRSSELKLKMQPAPAGQAPSISTEATALGQTVSETDVNNLPISSSNLVDFSLSVSSGSEQQVSVLGSSISEQQSTEQASAINASGAQRVNSTYYLLDNVENNGQLSGSVRQTLPLETVSQYQVIIGQNAAQYPIASASITNILTKSGSNDLKGVLYYNARNGIFNAQPYCFNNPAGCYNNDIYNSFGGTLGGPLFKDKTFFFASAEYTGENSLRPTIFNYANDAAYFTQVNNALQGISGAPLLGSSVTAISPQAYLPMSTAQTLASIRVDHSFNHTNTLMARVLYAQANHSNITNDCNTRNFSDISNCGYDQTHASSFVGAYTHVFSPTLLSEFQFQYSPDYTNQNPNSTGPTAYILDTTEMGQNYDLPTKYDESHYGWTEVLTKTKGLHLINFGAQVIWLRMFNYAPIQQQGRWEYSAASDFTAGTPYRLVQEFGSFNLQENETDNSFYLQDAWRVKPRFTLSYGIRYDVNLQPQGYNQDIATPCRRRSQKASPTTTSISPPALAWPGRSTRAARPSCVPATASSTTASSPSSPATFCSPARSFSSTMPPTSSAAISSPPAN